MITVIQLIPPDGCDPSIDFPGLDTGFFPGLFG
jgi:hypothetical protein